MEHSVHNISGKTVDVYTLPTLIVGAGVAGLNAADTLLEQGDTDFAILTAGAGKGSSFNTLAAKQPYYKLSLWSDHTDSVNQMAIDLMAHGGMDGDHALSEAALSAQCFYKLCRLGIPFPSNRYGEYVGYPSPYDTACRTTSAGPYTLREITHRLSASVKRHKVPVFEGYQVVSVLTHQSVVRGVLAYSPTADNHYALFCCANVIYATGGPAAMFERTAYPTSQVGATGAVLEAGAIGVNLSEWQYGITSVSPRFPVNSSCFQALPRIISVDENGREREFVLSHFLKGVRGKKTRCKHYALAFSCIFKKGTQWSFQAERLHTASVIDLLVFRERELLGRRVYLDFTRNTGGGEDFPFGLLGTDTREYLCSNGAHRGTPADRLIRLNEPAYQMYLDQGIDLKTDRLEIEVCPGHNNGGIAVDLWWQSSVHGLFVCGEAAGTHGVSCPDGSALNASMVGATRAATYVHTKRSQLPHSFDLVQTECGEELQHKLTLPDTWKGNQSAEQLLVQAQDLMQQAGGILRQKDTLGRAVKEIDRIFRQLPETLSAITPEDVGMGYRLYDVLISQMGYLSSMLHMCLTRESRGGSLYIRQQGLPVLGLPAQYCFVKEEKEQLATCQEIQINPETHCFAARFRPISPLQIGTEQFDNVWRSHREDGNVRNLKYDSEEYFFQTIAHS